ncbi:MAG: protein translocase subunit SecF [Clostridia bacterium]|nr:protein translocase subunit SecF [Clostridia bacterium]
MFDFVKKRKIFFTISLAIIVLGLLYTAIFGVSLDVSFKGGSILTYTTTAENVSDAVIKQTVKDTTGYDCTIGTSQDLVTGAESITISIAAKDGITMDQQSALTDALNAAFGADSFTLASSNNVNSTMGREFLFKCLIAALLALIVIIVYVGLRFKNIGGLSAGIFAMIALAHDVCLVFIGFVICGFSINANFIAVILTILGYSLNGTIVVYERIRENETLHGKKMSFAEITNQSINQSLRRTVNTSITTGISLVVMTVISYVFGVESIRSFSIPMLIGVVCGCYTSLCIAGPLWTCWQEYSAKRAPKSKAKPKSKKK